MTLDELQKICDAATPAHKPLSLSGISLDVKDADLEFIDAARTNLPKLIAVAKAAKAWVDRRGPKGQLGSAAESYALRDALVASLAALES